MLQYWTAQIYHSACHIGGVQQVTSCWKWKNSWIKKMYERIKQLQSVYSYRFGIGLSTSFPTIQAFWHLLAKAKFLVIIFVCFHTWIACYTYSSFYFITLSYHLIKSLYSSNFFASPLLKQNFWAIYLYRQKTLSLYPFPLMILFVIILNIFIIKYYIAPYNKTPCILQYRLRNK